MILEGKRVIITGGTGSLGKVLVRRILTGTLGRPSQVVVFSRDEAKQHAMRLARCQRTVATDEVIYSDVDYVLRFVIGDVRDFRAVARVLRDADCVIHAAALKQVPNCEYNPIEAVKTNVLGCENIIRAAREIHHPPIEMVVGMSSDKAVKPINVYGMTKAIHERLFTAANLGSSTRFVNVRYGNVLGSRGSVVPLFLSQIHEGRPITITSDQMTRFFFTLDEAVDTVFAAITEAQAGEIYVPKMGSARIVDVARELANGPETEIKITGIRPGEKMHEVLVSREELPRTIMRGNHYVVQPMLPELQPLQLARVQLSGEITSADAIMEPTQLRRLLDRCLAEGGRAT